MAIFKGILTGMGTIVFLGPVFFTLLKNAMQKGVSAGLLTAFGILVSDIVIAAICYYVAADFINEYVHLPIVKFVAASILLTLGFVFYTKPISELKESAPLPQKGYFKSFGQGFIVNFANPTVFVIWMGFVTLGQTMYSTDSDVYLYIVGILIGIFATDAAKAFGAAYLSPYLKSHSLTYLFRVIAIIVAGFGVYLIYLGLAQSFS
ncbi:MAG TPA: hypothetical protein DCY51_07075 [Bacteroidetes bacterium]|nr:hypothetical protein [Bacteroidota bacterium]